MSKLVRELMHPGLITCPADTTLGEVAVLLNRHHVHALIVVDRDGRPVGIISDFDLLAAEWLSTDQESLDAMRSMTAGELMTTPVDTIDAGETSHEAAERMRRGEAHRLLVTENGEAAGVISISDLVASMVAGEELGREKVSDVMSRAMLVCRLETPLTDVARGMTDAHYRSVLVVDEVGRPQGLVTGFDLMPYCGAEDCSGVSAQEVMNPPLTILPHASLREAADLMIKHHYHRLVVVDPEQPDTMPLGIISSYDIVAEMAQPGSVWR